MERRMALSILTVLGLALLGGCETVTQPNQRPPSDASTVSQDGEPEVEPTVLGEYELCAFATDAVRKVVRELWQAPDDEALIRQTIESYRGYARRLRELAAKAGTAHSKQAIEAAADAAEAYAAEVDRRGTYKAVDIEPVIRASKAAFPNCDLDG